MLGSLAGHGEKPPSRSEIETDVRQDVVSRLAAGLMKLAGGEGDAGAALAALTGSTPSLGAAPGAASTAVGDAMAPWIDTPECTACDECTNLNPKMFEYGPGKKAVIKDPTAGPYSDLVKAAERCTARVIHPGLPLDRSPKDIEKWIARAKKYN